MIASLSDRTNYNSLQQCIYLNQASLGLVSGPTVSTMHTYLDDIGRHGNMNLSDSEEVGLFVPLRDRAAKLMGCSPDQLAILGSAGEMLSQLPYLFKPKAGSKVIASSTDFPAITRPWIAYSQDHVIDVHFVDEVADHDLTDTLIAAIDDSTAVVLVSYVQYSTGSMIDCHRLRKATRAVGARLVLDVTQAAGAVPVQTSAWQADMVVCSGYKWLGGHGGVGLAVVAPEFLEVTPPAPGWMGAADPFDMQATHLPLAEGAQRYTQSTMSYISIIGLSAAISELLALNPENIQRHASSLATTLIDDLAGSDWSPYRPLGDLAASHIVSLAHPSSQPEATLQALLEANIICSIRNGRVRVSLAHFNDETDVHAIVKALRLAMSR